MTKLKILNITLLLNIVIKPLGECVIEIFMGWTALIWLIECPAKEICSK